MGAYENPKLTVIDPSKNLEAFERNFNKAYQAMATYRQEKAKREKAYEDAAFAVGVDMYKNIDITQDYDTKETINVNKQFIGITRPDFTKVKKNHSSQPHIDSGNQFIMMNGNI